MTSPQISEVEQMADWLVSRAASLVFAVKPGTSKADAIRAGAAAAALTSAAEALRDGAVVSLPPSSGQEGEVERLRAALIECCNAVGGVAGPGASTEFLLMVPAEARAKIASLKDALASRPGAQS